VAELNTITERMNSLRANLCALGAICQERPVLAPLAKMVPIKQKVVRYKPMEKLMDAFLGTLCGARTLVATNTTLRPDRAVSRACGRDGCAEQSTIWETIQACSEARRRSGPIVLADETGW